MGRKKKTFFEDSALLNNLSFQGYVDRITEIAISAFEWLQMPDTVDKRFLELAFFTYGKVCAFMDEVGLLTLPFNPDANFSVYGNTTKVEVYSPFNAFHRSVSAKEAIFGYNNMIRTNSIDMSRLFALRLYNIDRIIDVNSNSLKSPVIITCDEEQRLTLLNLFKEVDGNAPVIFGSKNIDLRAITALNLNTNYVGDKLTELKTNIWNEMLTYNGVPNVAINKRERLVSDEVNRGMGGTLACRNSKLKARQQFADSVNRMFDLDIQVRFTKDPDDQDDFEDDEEVEDDE